MQDKSNEELIALWKEKWTESQTSFCRQYELNQANFAHFLKGRRHFPRARQAIISLLTAQKVERSQNLNDILRPLVADKELEYIFIFNCHKKPEDTEAVFQNRKWASIFVLTRDEQLEILETNSRIKLYTHSNEKKSKDIFTAMLIGHLDYRLAESVSLVLISDVTPHPEMLAIIQESNRTLAHFENLSDALIKLA